MIINLRWPPKELSPNVRRHWAVKAAAARAYKKEAWLRTYAALTGETWITQNRYLLIITFHQPDRRERDMDNMITLLKYGIDGIALAMNVNDKQFDYELKNGDVIKGGRVDVEVLK